MRGTEITRPPEGPPRRDSVRNGLPRQQRRLQLLHRAGPVCSVAPGEIRFWDPSKRGQAVPPQILLIPCEEGIPENRFLPGHPAQATSTSGGTRYQDPTLWISGKPGFATHAPLPAYSGPKEGMNPRRGHYGRTGPPDKPSR